MGLSQETRHFLSKQTNKIKTYKQKLSKKEKIARKTWSLFCFGQLLLDMGPTLECG